MHLDSAQDTTILAERGVRLPIVMYVVGWVECFPQRCLLPFIVLADRGLSETTKGSISYNYEASESDHCQIFPMCRMLENTNI